MVLNVLGFNLAALPLKPDQVVKVVSDPDKLKVLSYLKDARAGLETEIIKATGLSQPKVHGIILDLTNDQIIEPINLPSGSYYSLSTTGRQILRKFSG